MNAFNATIDQPVVSVVTVGEAGPAGPAGAAGGDPTAIISVQSGEGVIISRGTPVAMVAGVVMRASSLGPGKVYGLVYDTTIGVGGFGRVITGTVLPASTTEWDNITGGSGGLVAGSTYYLSTVAGRLVLVPNLTSGVNSLVGFAISSTQLRLFLGSPITL